jgi:hypothetical protein
LTPIETKRGTAVNPSYDFTGQVALVTGGSSGMGLATAQAFAEAGAAVILADVKQAALSAAAEDLTTAGHQALGVVCDVSQEDLVDAMVNQAVATFGRLDMAFNNAGIQAPPTDAADEPAEMFDRVNAINLRGVWTCMKHELRQMRAQGSGAIVNCSSLGGLVGLPGAPVSSSASHSLSTVATPPLTWDCRSLLPRLGFGSAEDLPSDRDSGHGLGPAGIERQVSDGFEKLGFGDSVLEGPAEVVRQLVGIPTGDQGGDGDEAAVPGGEFRPVPNVLEEHVVGERGKLRGDIADGAAAPADLSGLIDHQ